MIEPVPRATIQQVSAIPMIRLLLKFSLLTFTPALPAQEKNFDPDPSESSPFGITYGLMHLYNNQYWASPIEPEIFTRIRSDSSLRDKLFARLNLVTKEGTDFDPIEIPYLLIGLGDLCNPTDEQHSAILKLTTSAWQKWKNESARLSDKPAIELNEPDRSILRGGLLYNAAHFSEDGERMLIDILRDRRYSELVLILKFALKHPTRERIDAVKSRGQILPTGLEGRFVAEAERLLVNQPTAKAGPTMPSIVNRTPAKRTAAGEDEARTGKTEESPRWMVWGGAAVAGAALAVFFRRLRG